MEFSLAEAAYNDYCSNGRNLFFAKLLRQTNSRLIAVLNESIAFLDYEGIHEAAKVIYHLESWTLAWDNHLNSLPACKQSDLQSEFIFQSRVRFPKSTVEFFKSCFENIVEEGNSG